MIFKQINFSKNISQYSKLSNAVERYNGLQSRSQSFQNQYNKVLQNSTSSIGKYLQSLNGAEASLSGYIKYLVTTKASTVALSVATTVMKTALIAGISVGISLLVQQISKWIHAQEEARQKAIELTNAYKEQKKSLDSQIEKYKELKEILDKGNLSTDETRSIKEQLLEIQKSLIESYGIEASNIDLVNGKYREQLGLLSELSKEKATDYVKENRSAFEDAKKELEKIRTYKIGSIFSYNARAGKSDAQKQLYDYIKSYSDLFEIRSTYDTSTFGSLDYTPILFVNANADDAKFIIDQFYDDVEKYIKENNLQLDYDSLQINLSKASSSIETNDALKEYREIYDEFLKAEIVRSDTLRPLYQQSIQAVEDYNKALSSGEGVEEAKEKLDSVQQSVQNATSELEGSQDIFNGIYERVNKNTEAAYNFSQAFENDNTIKGYAEQLRGLTDIDLKAINFKDNVQSPGEEAFKALMNVLGLSEDDVQKLIDKLVELGYIQGKVIGDTSIDPLTFNDIFAFKDADGNLNTLGKINERLNNIQAAYKNLTDAMDTYSSTGSITIDQFQSIVEQGDDFLDYLTLEDGQLGVNEQAMYDLAEARIVEMKAQMIQGVIDNVSKIKKEGDEANYLASTNYDLAESYDRLAEANLYAWKTKALENGLSQSTVDKVVRKAQADINKIKTLAANIDLDSLGGVGKAASSATKSFTDLLDKQLNVLDKKMEAGYIDFNDYIKARLDLIEDYYRQGKLAADEYYSYLEKHYNQELTYRDKVIKAVTRRIDNEIDDLEKQKDDIESYYKVQIDALNKEKTLLEDANKERQREIDLQKAMYDLERAKNQRTKLIYSEDKGMHYVADDSAIKDASQEVENAEYEIKISEIEKAITKLEEARDAETDAIDDMIDKLKEYRDQWNDITSAYEESQEDLLAAQMLGQDWEKDIIDTRLDTLNKFKDDYIAIQQAMVDAAYQAAQAMEKQEQIKIGGSSEPQYEVVDEANPMSKKSEKFSSKKEADEYAEKQNKNRAEENGMTLAQFNNSDIPGYFVYKKKYHAGLKQGRIGQHSFDEDFKLVQKVGLGDKDVPAILKEGEAVATPEQISNIADGIRSNATPYDPDKDDSVFGKLYKAWHAYNDTNTNPIEEMSHHILTDHSKQMNEVVNRITNATNIMNHRNAQPIVNQNITLNCPNLTNSSGIEYVQRELGHLSQMALQEPLRKY